MIDIFKKYPNAANVVKAYYLEKMIESLKDKSLPEDFKKHMKDRGIEDETLCNILDGQPRALFDVFDENEIYISTSVNIIENGVCYRYSFDGKVESNDYNNRKEAEKEAIIHAFELLENKLKDGKED